MRPLHAGFAALCILAMTVFVLAGGQALSPPPTPEPDAAASHENTTAADTGPLQPPAGPVTAPGPSRPVRPEIVAPPALDGGGLERIAPRQPLSDLALATPPKPKPDAEWKGATLFRPLAPSAGVVAAQGRTVTVAGIEVVAPGETCTDAGRQWPCGARATTAFRAFLRGRAVVCDIPDGADSGAFTARCRLAKQDIGEWLVENGWARADAGGPYGETAEKARKGRKGIYGAAPDRAGIPPVADPAVPIVPSPPAGSIIDLSGEALTPPTGQPAPER